MVSSSTSAAIHEDIVLEESSDKVLPHINQTSVIESKLDGVECSNEMIDKSEFTFLQLECKHFCIYFNCSSISADGSVLKVSVQNNPTESSHGNFMLTKCLYCCH